MPLFDAKEACVVRYFREPRTSVHHLATIIYNRNFASLILVVAGVRCWVLTVKDCVWKEERKALQEVVVKMEPYSFMVIRYLVMYLSGCKRMVATSAGTTSKDLWKTSVAMDITTVTQKGSSVLIKRMVMNVFVRRGIRLTKKRCAHRNAAKDASTDNACDLMTVNVISVTSALTAVFHVIATVTQIVRVRTNYRNVSNVATTHKVLNAVNV